MQPTPENLQKAKDLLNSYRIRCEQYLAEQLPEQAEASKLYQAMRYSLFAPSKRLRPGLIYAMTQAIGAELDHVDAAAAAIECMHTFSLIHDDLPAMDDDDLRRGLPSSHCVFGEDIAILAGDALLSYSFEILGKQPIADHLFRKNVTILAKYSGEQGMALGQAMDCIFTKQPASKEDIITLQYLKTGALFKASLLMGAISCDQTDAELYATLSTLGYELGLIFQLKDDLLDIEGTTAQIGKPVNSDADANKPSYAIRYGVEATKTLIDKIYQDIQQILAKLPFNIEPLQLIILLIVHRDK